MLSSGAFSLVLRIALSLRSARRSGEAEYKWIALERQG
jgi:hypothetical protein